MLEWLAETVISPTTLNIKQSVKIYNFESNVHVVIKRLESCESKYYAKHKRFDTKIVYLVLISQS